MSVIWVQPSGQTLLPLYLFSSLLLISTQVVQFELYKCHHIVVAALGIFISKMNMLCSVIASGITIASWLKCTPLALARPKECTASKQVRVGKG